AARLARGERLGQEPAPAHPAARGGRLHPAPLRRRLRAPHRHLFFAMAGRPVAVTMAQFPVLVEVTLRAGIADPQGATIERALPALGFDGVVGVRVGTAIRFTVEASDREAARAAVDDLFRRFLANLRVDDTNITIGTGDAQ